MPIVKATNKTINQISTTIGLLPPNSLKTVSARFDVVPKILIDELEELRSKNWISFFIEEDPDIADDVEAAASVALIGEPTSGSLPSPITPKTSMADAIQIVGSGAVTIIGDPTAGDYSGVIPTIDANTKISDAFQAFGEFNTAVAPAQPGNLTGKDLTIIGTALISAKIPNGLAAAWSPLTPGQLITNLIVDGLFTLESPDQANVFTAGLANELLTAGQLDLLEDGSVSETYNIATNGVGTIGRITITDIAVFNTIWQKVNAEFAISISAEGRHRFSMQHTEAILTNEREFFFDDVNSAPTFSSPMSATINTAVSNFLSGIEALGAGSTLDVDYTAAGGIFRKTYHPTAVGQVSGPGYTTSIDNPVGTPSVNDTFVISKIITLSVANQFDLTPSYAALIQKPDGQNANSADTISKPVNTYGTISTGKDDQFFDEVKRIVLDSGVSSGTSTAFTSSAALVNGNAQQRHSGILQFPDSTDYPSASGDQEYQRFMDKISSSIGALTFQGVSFSDIDPFGTGDLNVLIELATQGKFFDIGLSIGSSNGDSSGSSRANSVGARNDSLSSGGTLNWSVGTDSTAINTNEYRLIVIFRNNNHTISRITEV